jgi:hypothetical protein
MPPGMLHRDSDPIGPFFEPFQQPSLCPHVAIWRDQVFLINMVKWGQRVINTSLDNLDKTGKNGFRL